MDPDRTPAWRRYLRFWGTNVRSDVTEEIDFHLQGLIEEYVAAGMSRDDATRLALRRFGDPERIGIAMRTLAQQRELTMQRTEWLAGMGRDFHFGLRQLAKRPGFTIVAVMTLALGIGANTAMFSAVNTVLLHPIAAEDLDRIVFVYDNLPRINLDETPLDPPQVLALGEQAGDLFEASGAVQGGSAVLTGLGEPRRLARGRTMGRFFDTFGVRPHIGRLYRADDSESGRHNVVVLAYDFWRELGADPSIVGRSLTLNAGSYEVIGVMQPEFRFPRSTQFWTPYPVTPQDRVARGRLIMTTVAKVRPGVTQQQIDARLDALLTQDYPTRTRQDFFMSTRDFVSAFAGQLRPTLIVLLAAVGFVLLIACANVASLQLVHGAARTRELSVRAAMGASRWTLIRQLLVENLVLSIAGGVLGVLIGLGLLRVLSAAGAAQLPALQTVRFDGAVLAFAAVATIMSGLLFGIAPALRAGRVDLHEGLKEGTRTSLGRRRSRLLQSAVVVQVALSVVLLLGSALMIRSLRELLTQPPGFDPEQVHTMRLTITGPRSAPRQLTLFYNELLTRVRAQPGIDAVGLISDLPFTGGTDSSPFSILGRESDPSLPALHANLLTVGGDYFKALRIPLLAGRAFDETDTKNSMHVVVIDETLAKTYFPDETPIGKRISQGMEATIIGVVGTVSHVQLGEAAKSTMYYPYTQRDWYGTMYLAARSPLPLGPVQSMVRSAVQEIDPNVPLFEPRTLTERIGVTLAPRRLTMIVLSGLAALALGLAVFGLYGVISYTVSQRTTEFGIRLALGAQPGDVVRMVMSQGLFLALAGLVAGIVAAAFATRALASLVFGVSTRDPLSFAAGAVILAVVAVLASYVPARRVTRVSPVDSLRA